MMITQIDSLTFGDQLCCLSKFHFFTIEIPQSFSALEESKRDRTLLLYLM